MKAQLMLMAAPQFLPPSRPILGILSLRLAAAAAAATSGIHLGSARPRGGRDVFNDVKPRQTKRNSRARRIMIAVPSPEARESCELVCSDLARSSNCYFTLNCHPEMSLASDAGDIELLQLY